MLTFGQRSRIWATMRAVDARRSKLGGEQVTTAEDVERQVAIAVVIALEVAAFLKPEQPIIGRIEIEYDADRRFLVRVHEHIDEQPLNGSSVVVELVMPVATDLAGVLQPIERRLARERVLGFVECRHQCRIESQHVVIDQILVAEPETEYPLA